MERLGLAFKRQDALAAFICKYLVFFRRPLLQDLVPQTIVISEPSFTKAQVNPVLSRPLFPGPPEINSSPNPENDGAIGSETTEGIVSQHTELVSSDGSRDKDNKSQDKQDPG